MPIERIFDLLEHYSIYRGNKEDVLCSKENGKWQYYSCPEYIENAGFLSCGLLSLGLKKGDRVVSISNNRPEWNFLDMALSQSGLIHVPVYPTISESDYLYILNHCTPKLIFISDKIILEKINHILEQTPSVKQVYTFNKIDQNKHWTELRKLGERNHEAYVQQIKKTKEEIKPDDLVTIIYTSGTTGNPKGVMLSHKNILSNMKAAQNIFNFRENQRTLSFLPICHIYERMVNYLFQFNGVSIYYAENMGTIADNLKEVRPHIFISVPRLLERVYDKIMAKGRDLGFIKKAIFFWAVNLGLKYDYIKRGSFFYRLKLRLADKLVFTKWREALGGCTELIVVGSAALQPRLSRVFGAAGIAVLEGYGLTETSPVIAANNFVTKEIMVGTVGPVFQGVQVKIANDGEILCKGPGVMLGYYNDTKLTAEAIDNNGWFHTGDIGIMVDDKYLKITDRKKEIFKLSSGKYVSPQLIENILKESAYIEQLMVVGENEKFASALIAPNFQNLHNWCFHHHINFRDNNELVRKKEILDLFQDVVNRMNKKLGQTEQVKRFRLVCEEWTPLTGELSPTLKLKRKVITEKYKSILDEIYSVQKS